MASIFLLGDCCLLTSQINGHSWFYFPLSQYSLLWSICFKHITTSLKHTLKPLYFANKALVGKPRSSTYNVKCCLSLASSVSSFSLNEQYWQCLSRVTVLISLLSVVLPFIEVVLCPCTCPRHRRLPCRYFWLSMGLQSQVHLSTSSSNLRQLSVGSRFQNELSQYQEKSSQQWKTLQFSFLFGVLQKGVWVCVWEGGGGQK